MYEEKGKEGIIQSKFLHLNGITSAPSAMRAEETYLAGRDTPRTLAV